MPSEETGRRLLQECFLKAGYAIEEDHRLREQDLDVVVDGFDVTRRVGYEFITTEAGDRERLSPGILARLETRIAAGELHLLIVDEHDAWTDEDLVEAAVSFIEELRRRGAGA